MNCPKCNHQELPGALFCSECGAQLVEADTMTTHQFTRIQSDVLRGGMVEQSLPLTRSSDTSERREVIPLEDTVEMTLVDFGKTISLSGRREYTLGRVVEGQPILPDVDFSEFDAYQQGVSRLHASLKINPNRVVIMDLGSSNGTRVNGQKIVPHVDYPIKDGDLIALGKFKIHINIIQG